MEFIKKMLTKKNDIPQVKGAEPVDYVELGNPQSEKNHQGLYSWGEKKEHPSSNYGGEEYTIYSPKKVSVRNFAGLCGVVLKTGPEETTGPFQVYLSIFDTPYEVGMMKHANKETRVLISPDGEEWTEIGSYLLSYEDKISTFQFEVDQFTGEKMYIQLENLSNIQDGENHYGQSVHFIGLYKKV